MGNYTQNYADLHVHLEGTVTPSTLRELAQKNGVDLSAPTQFLEGIIVPGPQTRLLNEPFSGDFRDFILRYVKIVSCIRSAEDLLLIGRRYLEAASTDGVIAADIYLSPSTLLRLGVGQDEIARGLLEIQALASRDYNFRIRWIFDIVRGTGLSGMETIDAATHLRDAGVNVVYIGLGGMEAGNSAKPFKAAFDRARDRGFRILAHAGETAGAKSIWETIETANPERIGHGITCLEDPKLVAHIREKNIVLEVCPWSNILLGICDEQTHPIKQLIDAGLQIVICSDDPGIFGRSLKCNYELAEKLHIGSDSLEEIRRRSLVLI